MAQGGFTVSPPQPLIDEPVRIVVSGLAPNRLITLRGRSKAQDQLWWQSEAIFNSGPMGRIDLGVQAPASGSYGSVDPMGIFWSMRPEKYPKGADHAFFAINDLSQPIETNIDAVDAGQVVATVTIERRYFKPGVECAPVKDSGLTGLLCYPRDGKQHAGVLVLGGSEGGIGLPGISALLAAHGFAAFSLSYFGASGQPQTLQNIPMEYFERAADWMRSRPQIVPQRIAVLGVSRGAEAALQLGAIDPTVGAVVARSPSFVRWEGISAHGLPGGSAWTYFGKALPYIPHRIPAWFATQYLWGLLTSKPVRQTPLFLYDLNVFGATGSVEIPVENIHGPILLLSGKDDQIWPGAMMAGKLMARLQQHGHPYPDIHLSYDQVGHWIPCEYLPAAGDFSKLRLAIGGTAEGVAKAQGDGWPRILSFLTTAAGSTHP
jgi:dienelactone hydrolase